MVLMKLRIVAQMEVFGGPERTTNKNKGHGGCPPCRDPFDLPTTHGGKS